jgi:hypothetical protein
VAAKKDYKDRVTGATIPAVTTAQIYKGSIAFIVLQVIMVAAVIAYPALVSGSLVTNTQNIDAESVLQQMDTGRSEKDRDANDPFAQQPAAPAPGASAPAEEDPMKGLLDAVKQDQEQQQKK